MTNKNLLISAFNAKDRNGGGWASRRILNKMKQEIHTINRTNLFVTKLFFIFQGILLLPFLHSIFTRYIPLTALVKSKRSNIILNFSQTFGYSLFVTGYTNLICHDLQCHHQFFLKKWVRWSEGYLLRRASLVTTLSDRDAYIVHRYYKVSKNKVISLQNLFTEYIQPFSKEIVPKGKIRLAFLGGLERKENLNAILWFDKYVAPYLQSYELFIIGNSPNCLRVKRINYNYLGFIEDLHHFILSVDIVIAPMQSSAGVKIKVIESLELGAPVLGTKEAYSGISLPSYGYCSNDPNDWIATINSPPIFSYSN